MSTKPLPQDRPTPDELAGRSSCNVVNFAGANGAVCPYCGCTMFTYKTRKLDTRTIRYERCRNQSCGRKFMTRQAHPEIIREVGSSDDSE